MPTYLVKHRLTGQTWMVDAPFAQDACEAVGLIFADCLVELIKEGPFSEKRARLIDPGCGYRCRPGSIT